MRYPPGPMNWFAPLGLTWRHALHNWLDPLHFVSSLARDYGDIAFFKMFWYSCYQLNHPDLVREVLVAKSRVYLKEPRQMGVLSQFTGQGVITTEGPAWIRQRRIMQPAFQGPFIESILQAGDNGPFDEAFFMYSEELDLCHRLRLAGWRIVYEPTALILHYEGRSSEQAVATRHIRFNTSKVRYYEKYFGRGWGWALRHYLLFEFRIQLLSEEIKLRLGHKSALRRERIAVYQAVLHSQLRTW